MEVLDGYKRRQECFNSKCISSLTENVSSSVLQGLKNLCLTQVEDPGCRIRACHLHSGHPRKVASFWDLEFLKYKIRDAQRSSTPWQDRVRERVGMGLISHYMKVRYSHGCILFTPEFFARLRSVVQGASVKVSLSRWSHPFGAPQSGSVSSPQEFGGIWASSTSDHSSLAILPIPLSFFLNISSLMKSSLIPPDRKMPFFEQLSGSGRTVLETEANIHLQVSALMKHAFWGRETQYASESIT